MFKPAYKNIIKINALLLAGLGLAGCVPHLTKQQCESINWYQLGYQDGSAGHFQRNLSKDIQDCARFKLQVNTPAYHKGWQAGVRTYCQPQNGYNLGVSGQVYPNICPADLTAKFNAAWRRGLRKFCVPSNGYNVGRSGQPFPTFCAPDQVNAFRSAYEQGHNLFEQIQSVQAQINDLQAQIADLNNQIADRHGDIAHLRGKLVRNRGRHGRPYSPAERALILMSIERDRHAIDDMEGHIDDLGNQINELQGQLNHLKSQ